MISEQLWDRHLPSSRLVLPSSVANPVATYTDCSWAHGSHRRCVPRYIGGSIPSRHGISERRFALVDFTYRGRTGRLRFHEAGHTYVLPRVVAHAATKRELVAKQRPPHWTPPSIFRPPEALTEVRGARCSRRHPSLDCARLGHVREPVLFLAVYPSRPSSRLLAGVVREKHASSGVSRPQKSLGGGASRRLILASLCH